MKRKLKNHFVPHKSNGHIPHLLSGKSVLAGLCLALLIQLSIYAGVVILPKVSEQFAAVLPSVVTLLTNDTRASSNIPVLETSDVLTRAAQAKADDMASRGYFAHQSPDGREPWDWMSEAGYKYEYAGENLAVNFTDSEEVVEAWKNSPSHNENLMSRRYTEIGVAMAEGMYKGREAVFVVQMFASPAPIVPAAVQKPDGENVRAQAPALDVLGASTEKPEIVEDVQRAMSSPRTYGTYALALLALLFFIPLSVGWGRHHPKALANGAVAIAVLAGVIFINSRFIFPALELPSDAENSATAFLSHEILR
jgi:hypothetical protein